MLTITDSRIRSFRSCARLHHFEYVLRVRPVVENIDKEFGTCFHAGLEHWWTAHMEGKPDEALERADLAIREAAAKMRTIDATALAKLQMLMIAYDARWSAEMADWEVLGVEVKFFAPMRDARGRKLPDSKAWACKGKIDAIARKRADGTIWIVEHKTSGADLSAGSTYWSKLRLDSQVSAYYEGAASLGYEVAGCLYDVIAKPGQRMKMATPEASRKYTKEGKLYANQRATDETVEEFRERLAVEISENIDEYMQRAEVIRLPEELAEARRDVTDTVKLMKASVRLQLAPRNSDACFRFGGKPCAFYDVCSGTASLDDLTRFKKLESIHPELTD